MSNAKDIPIQERTFRFALSIINLCQILDEKPGNWTLSKQLFRSGTSVGANVEEAQAAQSTADFINKLNIALKEARESNYWLRLIIEGRILQNEEMKSLLAESKSIMNILGAIIVSTKSKHNL
jgi:four helix bundle protein